MPIPSSLPHADPKGVTVNVTTGAGMEIDWKDGHHSSYTFQYLRDACPCALCDEEREKTGRQAGEPVKPPPGALPMFKPAMKPADVERMGKYAIRFTWNDKHEHGIYSWDYLRWICPCSECRALRSLNHEPAAKSQ